jgi:hypothetical protein
MRGERLTSLEERALRGPVTQKQATPASPITPEPVGHTRAAFYRHPSHFLQWKQIVMRI